MMPKAHRPSVVSRSSAASGDDFFGRVRSLPSTGVSLRPSPCQSPKFAANPQKILAQLAQVAQGHEARDLELYDVLRRTMQCSPIFGLFEQRTAIQDAMVERLRRMRPAALTQMVREQQDIITWRQEGLGPAKVAHGKTPLEVLGLVAAAYTLLGWDRGRAACAAARAHISSGQQAEKRFTVLLLATAAALGSSQTPIDIEPLRKHCKGVIDHMQENHPKKQAHRRDQLLKKMGRFLTQREAEKLKHQPQDLPGAKTGEVDEALCDDEGFVHIEPRDGERGKCLAQPAAHLTVDSLGPVDKTHYTRGWLASLWG